MSILGGITEVKDNDNSVDFDELAKFAIAEHNKKENAALEFGKVIEKKQQAVQGTMYYIKVEANDGGEKKTYEAKVWVKLWENFKELQELKLV
ncbi:hypothetical protein M8C21_032612 [Ambrosia artemisiifolia]|uniref:Cysteine proteinase inhibitor n=1 Tax=Ambrosia artemisiifolia TaxID=4212 RepID=Q38678_AMBAR|nr:cystatin proteinase inhibitor [Ambrosia artemisiifolia]KAI7728218.1 hypothetical protein M8C21_020410 [Ambrosia artemisiifolia]KAI7728220.1 hypothetical protein M8C21_032612 [Ambrosia artemisiifolia]